MSHQRWWIQYKARDAYSHPALHPERGIGTPPFRYLGLAKVDDRRDCWMCYVEMSMPVSEATVHARFRQFGWDPNGMYLMPCIGNTRAQCVDYVAHSHPLDQPFRDVIWFPDEDPVVGRLEKMVQDMSIGGEPSSC